MADVKVASPLSEGLWLKVLLFSTLIPTVLHLTALFFSCLSLHGPKPSVRREWAACRAQECFKSGDEGNQQVAGFVARWQTYGQGLVSSSLAFVATVGFVVAFGYGFHAVGISPAHGIAWVARGGVYAGNGFQDVP